MGPRRNVLVLGAFIACLFLFFVALLGSRKEYPGVGTLGTIRGAGQTGSSSSQLGIDQDCSPVHLQAAVNPNGSFGDLWSKLRFEFETHKPIPKLRRASFPKPDAKHTKAQIIKDFLPITTVEADVVRSIHEDLVGQIPEYPKSTFHGKGVVIIASAAKAEYATTNLGMLRFLQSELPIELWMLKEEDEREGWCDELVMDGIMCRFLEDYIEDVDVVFEEEFQYTSAALFFSSFEEILLIDTNTIPLSHPDSVFNSHTYRDNGVILWPDYWKMSESPWTPYIVGASTRPRDLEPTQMSIESGQMVWNKKTHWKALALAFYYSWHGPEYYYSLTVQGEMGWGDKETYPTALRATSSEWHTVKHHPKTAFWNNGDGNGEGSGVSLLQSDPSDDSTFKPMFMHATTFHWSVRNLMCDDTCLTDHMVNPTRHQHLRGGKITAPGIITNSGQHGHDKLKNHYPLIAWKPLEEMGVDPEPMLWTVMERVACEGVWSQEKLCQTVREHMRTAFGIESYWRVERPANC